MTPVAPTSAGVLATKDLRRSWVAAGRTTHGLCGVSLEIPKGARVAITGPSGSGKSTLLHVLGGLDRGYTGQITAGGVDFARLDDAALSRFRATHLGFVFQHFNLLPHLTVRENVLLPATFGARVDNADVRASELLARVGLADRADAWPSTLSGGQQQRVAIARALLGRTDYLLCDEPTGSLDRATGEDILSLLFDTAAEHGAALVIVTHEPRVYARADRQLSLEDGAVVRDGPPNLEQA